MNHDYAPDSFLRLIAEPTRLRIVLLLSQYEELCVCDLHDVLTLSQPKVSRHLKALRDEFIVLPRKDGLWIHYGLHPHLPDWAIRTLHTLYAGCSAQQPYASDWNRAQRSQQRKKSAQPQ